MTENITMTHLVFPHCLVGTREAVHIDQRITLPSVAPGVRVALEVGRAAALGPVVDGLTVGALPTGSPGADVLTPVAGQVTFL